MRKAFYRKVKLRKCETMLHEIYIQCMDVQSLNRWLNVLYFNLANLVKQKKVFLCSQAFFFFFSFLSAKCVITFSHS